MEDSLVIIESQVIVLQMCVKGYLCSYENVDFWQKEELYVSQDIISTVLRKTVVYLEFFTLLS